MAERIWNVMPDILAAFGETLYMLSVTLALATVLGGAFGVVLYTIRPDGPQPRPHLYRLLDAVVNVVRSMPFLILMVAVIPFTRIVVGTSIGTSAVIVPLTIAAIPDFARLVEQTLRDVNPGVLEAGEAMGASPFQIARKILLREARSGLVGALVILTVNYISFTTVAGLVGGGGIGDFAVRYGYYRYQPDIMVFTVILIIIWVQVIQALGNALVRRLDKRR